MNKCVLAIGLALLSAATLSGCESSSDDALANAQSCLDKAQSATDADTCEAMISSDQSQAAYLIRCSADFIAQGFTNDRIATAFNSLQNGTSNPTAAIMANIVFAQSLPDHTIAIATTNCNASGVSSLMRLVLLSEMATQVATIAGNLSSFDPTQGTVDTSTMIADLNTLYAGGSPNAQTAATLGNLAIQAAPQFCTNGSAFSGTQVCTVLQTATSGSQDPATVGTALLSQIHQ